MSGRLQRGQVRLYDFDPPDKRRPVVVLSEQRVIDMLPEVTVASVTSRIRGGPNEVLLGTDVGLDHESVVNLHYVQAVPKQGLHRLLGHLDDEAMEGVLRALEATCGCD